VKNQQQNTKKHKKSQNPILPASVQKPRCAKKLYSKTLRK